VSSGAFNCQPFAAERRGVELHERSREGSAFDDRNKAFIYNQIQALALAGGGSSRVPELMQWAAVVLLPMSVGSTTSSPEANMQTGFLLGLSLTLSLSLCPASRCISARERNEPFAGQVQLDLAQSQSRELAPLPTRLTDAQVAALQELQPTPSQFQTRVRHLPLGFYRGAFNRPITPREVGFRESIYELAARPKQFVHVRLVDGRVLTGTIDYRNTEGFRLQTTIFGSGEMIRYRKLAEPPRPVLAVGTKTVRGLQTTGMVALFVVSIPLILVFYPLMAAGVIKD
jgi:hypothetical protein